MVEKIIVTPDSIRGHGNIVLPNHGVEDYECYNCIITEEEDTVGGATVTVYELEYQGTSYTVALTVSSSTVNIGSSITLTATVTDEEEEPVEGVSVSFKVGSSIIGSDETDSSGEASYSYTCTSAGTLSITAICAGSSSSASTVTVNKLNTSTSLSSTGVNVLVGTSITLTATVTSSSTPIEGLTVTFKDGNTTLGTGTTNSSGQATYTTSSLSVATHSMTAVTSENDTYNTSTSSAVSVVVYDHSYSIAFSQSSYTAVGGEAELSITLLDNNVAVSGATISVTGSDSSLYSGITDSSGVAEVTVSVSATTTFTCSYSNVSDTCTVTTSSVIYQPALDGTETLKQLSGTTTVANGEMSGGASYLVGGWDNTIDWELTFEGYYNARDGCAIGLYFGNPTQRDRNVAKIMPPNYNRLYSYNSSGNSNQDGNFNSITQSTWLSFNIKKTGSTLTVKIGTNNATTHTFRYTSETNVCIGLDTWDSVAKIRNIIVDAL